VTGSWEAPRLAYELAADWADAAAARGPDGELPPVSKAWADLAPLEQHDVLWALSGQARVALRMIAGRRRAIDLPWILTRLGEPDLCGQAREALRALLAPYPGMPWQLPQCRHCAAITAAALAGIQYRAYAALGFSAEQIAANARGAAAQPTTVPVQAIS
jgi:hypothetical protein